MPATIAINLDDKAAAGLQQLTETLRTLSNESAELSQQQSQQITIVQQSAQDWKTFGSTVATAQATATAEVSKAIGKIAELGETTVHAVYGAEEFAFAMGSKVVTALTSAGLMALKYTLLTKGAVDVIKAVKGTSNEAADATDKHGASFLSTASKATAFGVVLATVTGRWESSGQAASAAGLAAVRTFTAVGPAIAAGTVLLSGYEAVMARTGIRIDELGNKTTNLDRVSKAAKGLTSDLSAVGGELASNLKAIAIEAMPLVKIIGEQIPKAWDEFDKVATRTADNNIKALNNIRASLSGVSQEQRDATEKLEAQRDKEKAGFANLQKFNEDLATKTKERARAAEIASITTIDALDREAVAVRNRAGALAQAGKDNKAQIAELDALEQQRTKIIDNEEAKRRVSAANSAAFRKQVEEEYTKGQQVAAELRVKASQEAYDKEKKILDDYASYRRNVAADARNEGLATAEALIKQSGESAKARANLLEGDKKAAALKQAERDTDNAMHSLKMKRIDEELRQALDSAKSEDEARKAIFDNQRKRAQTEAAFNRDLMVQKLQDRQAEADKAVQIEKAKQEALKKAGTEQLEKTGFNAQDLLKQANQRDVLRNLQQQARDRAKKYVTDANPDLVNDAMTDHGGKSDQQLRRLQAQAQSAAANEASRRFRFGKTDPTDLANAQSKVASEMLNEQGEQGKLTQNILKVMQDQLKGTAANTAATQAQQKQLDQIQRQVEGVVGAATAAQQRARAQAN